MKNGPTPHVSWKELGCKDGTPYPGEWRIARALPLAVEFERIRALVGKPLVIASAYRTAEYNRRVGGARNSQHVQGRALDLYPPKGMSLECFLQLVRQVANDDASAIYGLGVYPTFIHVDIRPPRADGKLTVWQGSRARPEVKDR